MKQARKNHFTRGLVTRMTFSLLALSPAALADVKLSAIFSDHMVLQRDVAVPVWGWAAPDELVAVSIAGQQQKTIAHKNGKRSLKLAKMSYGSASTLTVSGKNTITIHETRIPFPNG
jgi:sialate O-acetylesterase